MLAYLKKIWYLGLILVVISACSEDDNNMAKIQVTLVDAPADYEEVLIDIQEVNINVGDEEGGWQSLENAETGIFDILKLTNGEEAFLGEIELPAGNLSQIRLVLGDQNSLTIDGESTDLKVPSGSQSGLKVKVNTSIEAGVTYKLVLDFDASKSIVKAGNSGKYNLKPVIRAKMEAQTGAIKGIVASELDGVISTNSIKAVVYAISGSDSISTYPGNDGQFLIRALEAGTYQVVAVPDSASNLTPVIENNVEVKTGEITSLDTLKFLN